jgi:hypothetical protein
MPSGSFARAWLKGSGWRCGGEHEQGSTRFHELEKTQPNPLDSLREMCDTTSRRSKRAETRERRGLLEMPATVRIARAVG